MLFMLFTVLSKDAFQQLLNVHTGAHPHTHKYTPVAYMQEYKLYVTTETVHTL